MSEADLLKALANHYKTPFITTEKLSKFTFAQATLDLVPKRVAESLDVCPILFNQSTQLLTVVTADPDNLEALNEVQLVSGVREVKGIVARPAAVRAAVAKAYSNDGKLFARLEKGGDVVIESQRGLSFHPAPELAGSERFISERAMKAVRVIPVPEKPPAPRTAIPPPLPPRKAATLSPKITDSQSHAAPQELSVELMNVLVSLLENPRQELRGHSAHVARLVRRLGERISLPREGIRSSVIAAFIHDLGKMGQFHLTALNASEYEGHKLAAQKANDTPKRLLEAVNLPADAVAGVLHMYERYDGKGFPDGLAAKEIPLTSRVLSICDTYSDLTQNARNPYRKNLSPAEAFGVLEKYKDSIFDPHLVDLFRVMMMGEDLRARLLANRYVALVVDADPEETTVLELRMVEQGFEVKIARTAADALKVLGQSEVDIVVSEVEMPSGDGLALLTEARKQPWGKDLPWVMHTRKQGRADAQRAFDLGVLDYASKLAPTDVLVAKIKAMLDQRAAGKGPRGVSGSLTEMSLPDMIQVLWTARKTGNLKIKRGGELGEIHILEGQVMNATWGKRKGEDAFYAMLGLVEGEFGLDPAFKPKDRIIKESTESLLLEGMRRLDEGVTAPA